MYDIKDYFKEFENGNLAVQRKDGLILFDYNRTCQFNAAWNETTLNARGIVFEEATGKLVANPFAKFFNLTEARCQPEDLPKNEPFMALEKCDGSCGICYWYNGQWNFNTRGSFASDQCIWAKQWFDKNVRNTYFMDKDYTYIFEIVYPTNRIVIDYKGKEMLVLLGIRDTQTGKELLYEELVRHAKEIDVEIVKSYSYNNLEEVFEAQKVLTSSEEGWVIWYPKSNFRFKLKGEEYCKIHKMISGISPISFWEAFDLESMRIPENYLSMLPEEFKETCDNLTKVITKLHLDIWNEIVLLSAKVPTGLSSKDLWFYCQDTFGAENGPLVKLLVDGKVKRVRETIHKKVRPDGNVIPGIDLSKVQKVLDEG
jgi:RNA ligase